MSPVRIVKRIDRVDLFAIVLRPVGAPDPVVLHSARDANGATMAFDAERHRLTQTHVAGNLLLVRQGHEARPLLWESLP
jgi:hypothetical protein